MTSLNNYRRIEQGDVPYIADSWLRHMRSQFPFKAMSKVAFSKYSSRVHGAIAVCDTIICYDIEEPSLIYGYINYKISTVGPMTIPIVNMVYVRSPFRRNLIASNLINLTVGQYGPLTYTNLSREISKYKLEAKWNLRNFDPYIMEGDL